MDLSVIIVNWNSRDHLLRCIASILAHTRDIDYEIVVIDSASFDGCNRMLRELYPAVHFIQGSRNVGFASSNNRAFQASIGDCLLFLNPDTELAGPAINTLHTSLKSLPNCGVAGCRLLNSDGTVQSSCIQPIPTILNQFLDSGFLRTRWPTSGLWGMAPLFQEATDAQKVEAIAGACLIVRRSTFEQVGMFSEDYFMYAEDIDLAYKVRKAGYDNYYVPEAMVIHHGSGSSQQAESRFAVVMTREAIWRFLRKTRGVAYGFGYRLAMCVAALVRLPLLAISAAFQTRHRRRTMTNASFHKWLAVLRWSLYCHGLVKQYYPRRRQQLFAGERA